MSKVKASAKFDYNGAAPFDRLVEALREIARGKICKPEHGCSDEGAKCGCLEFALRFISEREGRPASGTRKGGVSASVLSQVGLDWFGLKAAVWELHDQAFLLGDHSWAAIFGFIAESRSDFAAAWAEAQKRGI